MTIGDRIRAIREEFNKNQRDFASSIKIGQSTLAMFENGQREPKDIHIEQICLKYGVREEWLRNGNGEMHQMLTKNQEIGAFANKVMKLPDEAFKKRFIEALTKLDEGDWENIEKIANKLLKED